MVTVHKTSIVDAAITRGAVKVTTPTARSVIEVTHAIAVEETSLLRFLNGRALRRKVAGAQKYVRPIRKLASIPAMVIADSGANSNIT